MKQTKLTEKQIILLQKMRNHEFKSLSRMEVASMIGLRQKRVASFGSRWDSYNGKKQYCLISLN